MYHFLSPFLDTGTQYLKDIGQQGTSMVNKVNRKKLKDTVGRQKKCKHVRNTSYNNQVNRWKIKRGPSSSSKEVFVYMKQDSEVPG